MGPEHGLGGMEPELAHLLVGLTRAQSRAVTPDADSLCLMAPAGSGKTRVLTRRVARRVLDGTADADRVLVVTFTRKAAWEVRSRVAKLGLARSVRAGTFHSIALGEVRRWHEETGRQGIRILPSPAALLREMACSTRGPGGAARDVLGHSGSSAYLTIGAEIDWAKALLVDPAAYAARAEAHGRLPGLGLDDVAGAFGAYEREKSARGLLDFHDILSHCAELMTEEPRFAQSWAWRVRHLFVDEVQDMNPLQWQLLEAWRAGRDDLFVVGDPDQSIYEWNGADPTILARITDLVEGIEIIRLDSNHRSTPQILACARAVLGTAAGSRPGEATRPEGRLPRIGSFADVQGEATEVARWIRLAHDGGRAWSHIAVLARTNRRLLPVARALERMQIPFRLPGPDGVSREGPAVELSTFHRAKGLEWPLVAIIGLEDATVPPMGGRTGSLAEEQRLLYVAITRCGDELWCSWSETLPRDLEAAEGLSRPCGPSELISGLREQVAELESMDASDLETSRRQLARLRATLSQGGGDQPSITSTGA